MDAAGELHETFRFLPHIKMCETLASWRTAANSNKEQASHWHEMITSVAAATKSQSQDTGWDIKAAMS